MAAAQEARNVSLRFSYAATGYGLMKNE